MTRLVLTTLVAALTALPGASRSEPQVCPAEWSDRFAPAGLNSPFRLLEVHSGGVEEVLAIGQFTNAAGEFRENIARLVDRTWVGIERPADGIVPSRVDMRLGSADEEGAIVGGWLRLANGKHVLGIASYDAGAWTQIGTPLSEEVNFPPNQRNITSLHKGAFAGQQVLIAAGNFAFPGDPLKDGMAAWNGSEWLPLRTQLRWPQVLKDPMVGTLRDTDGNARLVVAFNDPGHEGGTFELVDGVWRYLRQAPTMFAPYGRLVITPGTQGDEIRVLGARKREITLATEPGTWNWNGTAWENLGFGNAQSIDEVRTQRDVNGGPWVVGRGTFMGDDGVTRTGIATLNGAEWEFIAPLVVASPYLPTQWDIRGSDANPIITKAEWDLLPTSNVGAYRAYRWSKGVWAPMDEYSPRGTVGGTVTSTLPLIDADGSSTLIVGGNFSFVEGQPAMQVASWNGQTWNPLGEGIDRSPSQMVAITQGDQQSVIALTGDSAGHALDLVRWDGVAWSRLTGLHATANTYSICSHPVEDGSLLIVAGFGLRRQNDFSNRGEIAAWDGKQWTVLARTSTQRTNDSAIAVVSHDDGSGPVVYCLFKEFGVSEPRLAKVIDGQYEFLSGETTSFGTFPPAKLVSLNDGRGKRLYAIGGFSRSSGAIADGMAVWNGSQWLPVTDRHGNEIAAPGGVGDLTEIRINGRKALAGIGPELIIWSADGLIERRSCFSLGYRAIAGFRRGGQDVLCVGGGVQLDPVTRTESFSEATFCPSPCPADINSDGTTDAMDLGHLLANFGTRNFDPMFLPDINTDGRVDGRDLAVLLATFGADCE